MKIIAQFVFVLLFSLFHAPTVSALGPVDGEIGIGNIFAQYDPDFSPGDRDADTLFIYGEGSVGDKWGIRGAFYDSDIDGSEFSNQRRLQFDIRRKLVAPTDNNFLALGVGWENIEFENGSDSNGVRLSAEGRVGLGIVYFYGRVGWIPWMEDAGNFEEITGTELDIGMHITPLPFVSIRLGYLGFELDFDRSAQVSSGSSTSGYYIAGGFHW